MTLPSGSLTKQKVSPACSDGGPATGTQRSSRQAAVVGVDVVGVEDETPEAAGRHLVEPGDRRQAGLRSGWSDLQPLQLVTEGGVRDELEAQDLEVEPLGPLLVADRDGHH